MRAAQAATLWLMLLIVVAGFWAAPRYAWAQDPPARTAIPGLDIWVNQATQTSLIMGWSSYQDHIYRVRWRPAGQTAWGAPEPASFSGHAIEELEPGSQYDVAVRARRDDLTGDDDWTDWTTTTAQTLLAPATPTPAPHRLADAPDVIATANASGYVYPDGHLLVVARYYLSEPVDQHRPDASEVISWRVVPPSASYAAGRTYPVSPVAVGDSRGYGEGMLIAHCNCYSAFDGDRAVEEALTWTLQQRLNPTRMPGDYPPLDIPFAVRFLDGDTSPAESAVTRILVAVDTRQGTDLIRDGYVTEDGARYIEAYGPGLRYLLPGIHHGVGVAVSGPLAIAARAVDTEPIGGPIITGGFEAFDHLTGIPPSMTGAAIIGVIALLAAAWIIRVTTLPAAGLAVGGLVIALGAVMGWVPMWIVIALSVCCALTISWMMFLKRGT